MSARSTTSSRPELAGQRVLITGAARGIGAELARRLSSQGAHVAVVGLEPELLESVARDCGGPAFRCDVRGRGELELAVRSSVEALGGLDVVVANAGVAAQSPMIGGDPTIFERIVSVNVLGTYYTLRAAAPHISHPRGYAVAIASLAAAVNLPFMAPYSASKAAVEVMSNTLRVELKHTGARVGVAYFSVLDTDMTRRGFSTHAGAQLAGRRAALRSAPLEAGVDALENGIARRARVIVAPRWVRPLLSARMLVQPVVERVAQRGLAEALAIAADEQVSLTTDLDDRPGLSG